MAQGQDDVDDLGLGSVFEEPKDFRKPRPEDEPGFDSYDRIPSAVKVGEASSIKLRLVGKSPLWGHLLWNAGKVTANYLDTHRSEVVDDKNVLELGAGAGLPSFIAALSAKSVVITDYPDADLIYNLQYNVDHVNLLKDDATHHSNIANIYVKGYIWGNDPAEILDPIRATSSIAKFDLIILSDVVFNHSEHKKLLWTCQQCLSKENGKIFVVFTPHRAKLYHRDLDFFTLAKDYGFTSTKIFEEKWHPMFEEEEETKELRSMVFGYMLTWA